METHDQQRRILLRGAFMSSCALILPGLLTGCDRNGNTDSTGTGMNETGPAPGAATSGDVGTKAQSGSKMSKQAAKYQDNPNGEQQCDNCAHYIAETNTCKLVEGNVSPGGWCMLWTRQV